MNNDEYLRRNQVVGEFAGLRSGLILMQHRIRKAKFPKWLEQGMEEAVKRAENLFNEMIRYRDGKV